MDFEIDALTGEFICNGCGESDFFCECNDTHEAGVAEPDLSLWTDGITDF